MTLRLLSLLLCLSLPSVSWAAKCLSIGDAQSALSIEKGRGFAPRLAESLKDKGYELTTYALIGSGAKDWLTDPTKNDSLILGELNTPTEINPFVLGKSDLKLDRTTSESFIKQIFNFHKNEDIDCMLIQLGDNDLFKDGAPAALKELVEVIVSQEQRPRVCGIVLPSFKELREKDENPFITNKRKANYIERVRHHLQKSGLLQECPLLSTMTPEVHELLKENDKSFTTDGLYFNDRGASIWVKEALKKHPLL